MASLSPQEDAALLPPLREDLHLRAFHENGERLTQIYDPLTHRYFDINAASTRLLQFWLLRHPQKVLENTAKSGIEGAQQVLEGFTKFLIQNGLVALTKEDDMRLLRAAAKQQGSLQARFSQIMFMRFPLGNPDRHLDRIYPLARPLLSMGFLWATCLAALIAAAFLMRQPEVIVSYLQKVFTLESGVAMFGVLACVKLLHEMGHAVQAKRQGFSVPSGGVMFILGLPLPFVELSHGWQARQKNDRLVISAGGILAELYIAAWASLLFVFWPDGTGRALLFMMASSSLVLSLVVNLNPLMRFDGYFMLSDATGMPNLQPRSSALGLWALRKYALGIDAHLPETLPKRQTQWMILYSVMVWIYRLFLFIGIAVLAYQMLSKVFGITVFVLEIWFFILLPMLKEMRGWLAHKQEILRSPRAWTSFAILGLFLALLLFPFSRSITIPARLEPVNTTTLFAPKAAIMTLAPQEGQIVKEGDVLWQFMRTKTGVDLSRVNEQIALLDLQIERSAALSLTREQLPLLQQRRDQLREERIGLQKLIQNLQVTSPSAGVILVEEAGTLPPNQPERPLGEEVKLGHLVPSTGTKECQITGYITADDRDALLDKSAVQFQPANRPHMRIMGTLASLGATPVQQLLAPEASAQFGGMIETTGEFLSPRKNWHRIDFDTSASDCFDPTPHILAGQGTITGQKQSILSRVIDRVLRVIVKELSA